MPKTAVPWQARAINLKDDYKREIKAMLAFLKANIGTIVVLLIVLILVALTVLKLVTDKRKGKCTCGCNCGSCSAACPHAQGVNTEG